MFVQIRGSPASQYGLCPTSFVIAVNGVKTLNLTDFLREVSKILDNTCMYHIARIFLVGGM